jgi:hypothetical protein
MLGVGFHQLALFVAALHFMAILANVKFHKMIEKETA